MSGPLPGGELAESAAAVRVGRRLVVEGVVQGVGFRPFVHGLAGEHALGGFVSNDPRGVVIEVEGASASIDGFVADLERRGPPGARVQRIRSRSIAARERRSFAILESRLVGTPRVPIAPDLATCDACLAELFDAGDRRYRHPFLSCTHCGPRFSIAVGVPYDRARTSMAGFPPCAACAREYADPCDRRFHAQPICCPDCGPRLRLLRSPRLGAARELAGDPVGRSAELLAAGEVIAVKGLGGYHLAARAADQGAVARLRARKHREDKPFAVMVPDLAGARALAELGEVEAELLASAERPIVLLGRRPGAPLAEAVAPGNRRLGLMLPYTPLHHLLCADLREPLVLTSGNVSDEPIAYRDHEALDRLAPIADAFLLHDRPIHVRCDDSVLRVNRGRPLSLRRSRGYAPRPLRLPLRARRPLLACGAHLKNTFCLVRGRDAYLSQHIGDLESHASHRSLREGIEHFCQIFGVAPERVAHDLHPDYASTRYALSLPGVERVAVQHHHAHVAACLAEHGESDTVIGVALDGLGYGADGSLWGGELLVADLLDFERAGHLEAVPLPGGEAAMRQPWRMACAYLHTSYGEALPRELGVVARNRRHWDAVAALVRSGTAAPLCSSAGRLFDAVAALLGLRDHNRYEGQAAVELEQLADGSERAAYPARVDPAEPLVLRGGDLFRAAVEDLLSGVDASKISARFHNGMARALVAACCEIRRRRGISRAVLSGGVFQNELLLERCVRGLEAQHFRVLVPQRVPCNDAGISFGQAVVAAARDRTL